jgi:hypothetical protein
VTREALATIAAALLALGLAAPAAAAGDADAAERQYRVARRLVAERSPEARAALDKVLALDPQGPRADDALVDQALLEGPARWPEQLGSIDQAAATRAAGLLERASAVPGADRAREARYLHALLRLEPLGLHDAAAARSDLIAVATDAATTEWTLAARYALAWLAAETGQADRAAAAYGRLLVDGPGRDAAARAATGLARIELRHGDPGWAALLLDRAVEGGVPPELRASDLRELAVRVVLGRASGEHALAAAPVVALADARLGAVAASPRGVLIADERRGVVAELPAGGGAGGEWPLAEVHALAVDPLGRIYAAAGERIVRLAAGRPPVELASLERFGPPQALVAEATGRLLLLDRKGATIAALDPGATSLTPFWDSTGPRLTGLARDGERLLALDAKEKSVVSVEPGGSVRSLGFAGLDKPVAFDVDAAGRIAVLDARESTIDVIEPDGKRTRLACKTAGIAKPALAGFSADGSLQVLDGSTSKWFRVQ